LISVFKYSYLVSITRRQQVATIRGYPIYVVTEVALTPCASQKTAHDAIVETAAHLKTKPVDKGIEESDSGDEEEEGAPSIGGGSNDEVGDESSAETEESLAAGGGGGGKKPTSTIAQDVMSRRGSYGRFAQRWFSRGGWMQDQKRSMGLSDKEVVEEAVAVDPEASTGEAKAALKEAATKASEDDDNRAAVGLLPKLLRTAQILFGSSRSFFFAYDYDITRHLARQPKQLWSDAPLYKTVDPLYFWNRHLLEPIIDAGAEVVSLPLMQGFVGQRTFVVDSQPPQVDNEGGGHKDSLEMNQMGSSAPASPPSERVEATTTATAKEALRPTEKSFDITLISRRSVKRAGLRYLRRGVDEQGNAANSVETEQILTPSDLEWSSKIYSFLQVRGSIPLFFTQTPYSLKPAPVIQHSLEANFAALKRHFDGLRQRYGAVQIVNLVEKHGSEATIGTQYERSVQRLNEESSPDQQVPFEWFDFHDACKGMKFENVSLLIDSLGPRIDSMGSTVSSDGDVTAQQHGVLRTNCMDCLDRTNVCQSSFAKHVLDAQLKAQGFDMSAQRDLETSWFNTLWADNGDAISKQYASTAAMKGDYTRTKKRNYRGALTDAGLSLTRFFNGQVSHFHFFLLLVTILPPL